jgi:hypothetical protein
MVPQAVKFSPGFFRSVCDLLAWGTVFIGSLSIAKLRGDWGHGVCGPWGCGPPLQALLACHVSWLVAFVPIAVWGRSSLRSQRRVWGELLILAALLGLIGVTLHEQLVWLPAATEGQRQFFWHRVGFAVATQIDWPFVELAVAGLLLLLPESRQRNRTGK